jgi:hypothetical protein
MELTSCHPRYVYALSRKIWDYCRQEGKIPDRTDVEQVWNFIITNKLKDIREMLSKRAAGQIKILSLIASGHTKEMTGHTAQSQLYMSGSAIVQSLAILEQDDYVERLDDGGYRIIDPLIHAVILQAIL